MKKKLLGVIMAGVLSAFTLTACGGDTAAEGEITFDDIQAHYSELVDLYNQVDELYESGVPSKYADAVRSSLYDAQEIMAEMDGLEEEDFKSKSQEHWRSLDETIVYEAKELENVANAVTNGDDAYADDAHEEEPILAE